MSYLAPIHVIGGQGGNAFDFNGIENGATLQKIWVWVGGWQVKAIKVWLTDGQSMQFGNPAGNYSEFAFQDKEHFTSLSLWGNGAGTRLGAIKFRTNLSREFFVKMTNWGLVTEYPIDIGSGICMGVTGRGGADIDSLGFIFLNTIRSTKLINVNYPTLSNLIPKVAMEEMKTLEYENNTSVTQVQVYETTKTVTRKSFWSVTNKLEFNFSIEVSAGIPEVMDVTTGFAFTVGNESSYGLENTEEKSEKFTFNVTIPPRKSVYVTGQIGRATVDVPYTGTIQITCNNGSVLEFPTSGTYNGVTYTDAKINLIESKKSL